VADIALADMRRAIMPMVDRGHLAAARMTQARIQRVLTYAAEHGWRPEDKRSSWSSVAPKSRGDAQHHPAVKWQDMPAVIAKLRAYDTTMARMIEFVALTAVRLSEAREARRGEFDLERQLWTIPAVRTKTRREHVVPLSDRALEIVVRPDPGRRDGFVFPGERKGKPLSRMRSWELCSEATEGRGSPHGFRSSFRSWCADHGVEFEVAETCLAHVAGGVVRAYQRSSMVERRRPVMEAWASFLDAKTANNAVVPFTRAAP
jgi:integrase